ncbi:hypothetical protein KY289_011563 [Solanum tuberosum]|nr:hypothetical protein KY289_011563 [Solanum tuberosum]
MGDRIVVPVDCNGEWVESNNRYIWRWKSKELAATIAMIVHRDIAYDDFVNKIITCCKLNCELEDIVITYLHSCGEKHKTAPFKINDQLSLSTYLEDEPRGVLRIYTVERLVENHNLCDDQQVLNDECGRMNMNIPNEERKGQHILSPEVRNKLPIIGEVADRQHLECKWWLRAVKVENSDRFYIKKYEKMHTCGSEHLTSHNPHATAKVIGAYFKDRYPEGKGPSTKDLKNSIRIELGCKVSYWKVWMGSEIAKSLVRGTHEHGYGVIDAYSHMLRTSNPGSKTALKIDENGRFKYFFVAYGAWILGFAQMRKVIAVDGTFLRSKYGGVLLSAVAQDAENLIFPVAFCIVDSECDASYRYFFEQLRSFVLDTPELCIISDRHQSIRKMVSIVFPLAHYGCCMRHLGENIRNNFHNASVVYHFYKAAKAYNIDVFSDHFNRIRDLVPQAATHLERVGFHRWSRAFFPGNRYNIMTTNIAESVNSMFLDEREYPITALFDAINRRFAEKFHERRMKFINAPTIFVPSIEKDIAKNINLGNKLLVHQTANYKYIVTGQDEVATVDLLAKSCTCKVFDIDKIPCPHAMAALRCQYGDDYGRRIYEYSSSYYNVEVYLIAYVEEIKSVPSEETWEVPIKILERKISSPFVEPGKVGRRSSKRHKGIGESFSTKKNKCSLCKRIGHKRTTCSERNVA